METIIERTTWRDLRRAIVSACLGCAGTVAALRGWGEVVVSPDAATAGQVATVVVASTWVAVWVAGRGHLALLSLMAAGTIIAMAPSSGRLSGAVLAASLVTARSLSTEIPPGGPARVSLSGSAIFAGAQLAWVRWDAFAPTVVLLLASFVLARAGRSPGGTVDSVERAARGAGRAATSAIAVALDGARRAVGQARRACPSGADVHGAALRAVPVALVSIGVAAAWSPAIHHLVSRGDDFIVLGINDYPLHVEVAERFAFALDRIEGPHLLFHATTSLFARWMDVERAAVVTVAVAAGGAAVALFHLLRAPTSTGARLATAPALLFTVVYFASESPTIALVAAGFADERAPFLTVHWWGNPTWMVALPFALAAVPVIERFLHDLERHRRPSPARRLGLATLLCIGALAKPGLGLALLPGLPAYLVVSRRLPWRDTAFALRWTLVPLAVVIAWQGWYLRTDASSQFSTGWEFRPIVAPVFGWSPMLTWSFWTGAAVLALALWATHGEFLREPGVPLVGWCSLAGLAMMLSLSETGERATHGNNAVAFQTCVTLLIALALRSCAWHVVGLQGAARSAAWTRTAGVVVVAFLAGGTISYLHGIGAIDVPVLWEVG